jgi:diguanylate cyclase (GGDEF)-like protein
LEEAWYGASSDPRGARAVAERALAELAPALDDVELLDIAPSVRARAILVRSNANYRLMRTDAALSDAYLARTEYEKLGDRAGVALACKTIGTVLSDSGDFDGGIDSFEKALAALKGIDEPEIEAATRNNYGEIFRELGRHSEALAMYERALEIGKSAGFRGAMGIYLSNIGLVQLAKGQYDEAEEHFRQALQVFARHENPAGECEALESLGAIALKRGEVSLAEARYREALARAEASGVTLALRDSKLELGRFLASIGRTAEARAEGEGALAIAVESGAERVELFARELLASVAEAEGEWREAYAELKRVRELDARTAVADARRQVSAMQARNEMTRRQQEERIYQLENVELRHQHERLSAAYERMRLVSSQGRAILASLDMEQALSAVRLAIEETLSVSFIGIAEVDGPSRRVSFRLLVERGERVPDFETSLDNPESLVAWCARNEREIVMRDVEAEYSRYVPRLAVRGDRGASCAFIPLTQGEEVVGVLMVEADQKNAFSEGDVDFLRALSLYVAQAIRNCLEFELEKARREAEIHRLKHVELREKHEELERALSDVREMARRENEYRERLMDWNANLEYEVRRRTEELEQLATTDPLTGLPNRRRAMDALETAFLESRRYGHALSVAMIDVDHFKEVNDSFGHAEGDRVLKEIAAVVASALREVDVAGRYGGEEFVMVLPETPPEGAEIVAERLRSLVEGWDFGKPGRVTVSIGVAGVGEGELPRDSAADGFVQLLEEADRCLYSAKNAGRNRVARDRRGGEDR